MFIRIYRIKEQKEILLNVNHISKIEVEYAVPGKDGDLWRTTLSVGNENPESQKIYRFWIAGESYTLINDPDDAVVGVIEDIYISAIKK